jgi:hypothetical protein
VEQITFDCTTQELRRGPLSPLDEERIAVMAEFNKAEEARQKVKDAERNADLELIAERAKDDPAFAALLRIVGRGTS